VAGSPATVDSKVQCCEVERGGVRRVAALPHASQADGCPWGDECGGESEGNVLGRGRCHGRVVGVVFDHQMRRESAVAVC
jgi:hypothetical protein